VSELKFASRYATQATQAREQRAPVEHTKLSLSLATTNWKTKIKMKKNTDKHR
jgi:hypothetical protein